jgi:hypothetical protein
MQQGRKEFKGTECKTFLAATVVPEYTSLE